MGTSSSVEAPEDGPAQDGPVGDDPVDGPVVEELTFRVEAELIEPWLARESASWDDYLARQAGFLRKEVWLDAEEGAPGTVRVLVWWAS
jgi:hypothetical protein